MTQNSVQSKVSLRTAITSEDPQCAGSTYQHDLSIDSGYTGAESHKKRKPSINDSGTISPETSRLRSPGESGIHSTMVGGAIDPDSKKELHKVRLQLTQRQQRIQALMSFFDTLLSKLKELDMLPGVSSIEIDKQFVLEGANEGVQRITQMFFTSTGVNPQPLLSIIENLGGKIQTILKRLKRQPEKEVPIVKQIEVIRQVIRQVKVEVPKEVIIEVPKEVIKEVPKYIEVIKEQQNSELLSQFKSKLESTMAQLEELRLKYDKVCRNLNDTNQLLKESESNLIRQTQAKNHMQQILDKSQKQKQDLVMYHQYKYDLIKRNYGEEKVSVQVVALLEKIHRLERKIREKQLETEKQKSYELKQTKQMLQIARKLKEEKSMNGLHKTQQQVHSSKIVNVIS